MIDVYDNILTIDEENDLEKFMLGDTFPWFFTKAGYYNTSTFVSEDTKHLVENNNNIKEYFVLSHLTYDFDRGVVSTFNDPCVKILESLITEKYSLLRIKCNLSPKVESFLSSEHNIPHVDFRNTNSKTILYYVNNSDGDTFFFNNEGKIIKRVSPKKGRFVVFNSSQLHAGSHPAQTEKRLCINFNLKLIS